MNNMNTRYRLIFRGIRGGMYYCVDKATGKRASLNTTNPDEARQILEAKNQAESQPVLNLQIAKAYIAGTDSGITSRTWQQAIEAVVNTKQGANKERWQRVVKDRALAPLLPRVIIETQGDPQQNGEGGGHGFVKTMIWTKGVTGKRSRQHNPVGSQHRRQLAREWKCKNPGPKARKFAGSRMCSASTIRPP
jgi:hypothetical protein